MVTPGVLLRFVLSALVGSGVAVGTAVVVTPPQIVSTAQAGLPVSLTGQAGEQLQFDLKPADPQPLTGLPATATLQLTSFHAAAASISPNGGPAPWWNSSVPRVPAISQFDGGPLQDVNCVMASGAMLARLGFGIVTTGSQLRALQDDQQGASNLADLETAVGRGWGISFFDGLLTPLQLRALLYAGAGAVIVGNYGEVPADLRLDSFTGSHAVYIDAFRPPGADGPAAYYVMDPLGHTWEGYKGEWWPADVVETFATSFGGGAIYSAWAFAGGVVPAHHPVLPPDAYPSGAPAPTPGQTTGPSGSPITVTIDPMPVGNLPIGSDPPAGTPPPHPPTFPPFSFTTNDYTVEPGSLACVGQSAPPGCPGGVVGVTDVGGLTTAGSGAPLTQLTLLYADVIAPNTYQIVFESPPGSSGALSLWSSSGGTLQEATVEGGLLGDKTVSIATVTLASNGTYSFVATATGEGVQGVSPVGALVVGQ